MFILTLVGLHQFLVSDHVVWKTIFENSNDVICTTKYPLKSLEYLLQSNNQLR